MKGKRRSTNLWCFSTNAPMSLVRGRWELLAPHVVIAFLNQERNIGILVVTTRAHKFNPRVYFLVTTHMHCSLSSTYRVVIFIHPVIELDHCYKPSSEHYSCRLYVVLHHKFPPTCRAVPQISQRASTHFAPPSVLHSSPDTSSRSTVSKVLCSVS